QHMFCVGHPSRAEASYKIDFTTGAFMDYVAVRRCEEVTRDGTPAGSVAIKRPQRPVFVLDPTTSALFRQIDGKRSSRACFAARGLRSSPPEDIGRAAFRHLWRLSHIFLHKPY